MNQKLNFCIYSPQWVEAGSGLFMDYKEPTAVI